MEIIKKSKLSKLTSIIKTCMLGVVITLLGIVVFAVVLKFTDLSSKTIAYVNDVIKAISLFVVVAILKKKAGNLLLSAVLAGVIYNVLAFVVFSILNGRFEFNLGFIYDLIFAVVVAVVAAVMLNLLTRK